MYGKLAWRNIWRSPKRTWITASSIAFAVFFAVVMQSMQLGSYDRMIENSVRFYTGHLSVHHENYWDEQILDNSISSEKIASLNLDHEEIKSTSPRLSSFALVSYQDQTKGAMINGVLPQNEAEFSLLDQKIVRGEYLKNGSVLVSEGLAEYLELGIGDTIVMISQGYHGVNAAGKYPVAGLVKFPVPDLNQGSIYMHLDDAQFFYGAHDRITSLAILLEDSDLSKSITSSLKSDLSDELALMDWKEMMPELLQGIEMDYVGGLIMIYILYGVIGFGILGTFLMMTKERTYEFGILCSIGMKKIRIQAMVTLEVVLLTFLGVAMGLVGAFPIVTYLYFNPIEMAGESAKAFESFGYEAIVPFSMDPVIFYSQGITVLIISLFLGLYPLLFIKRLKIIKALKE